MELLALKENIKKLRELKGYTQEQMADKLNGVKLRTYQDIENSRTRDISFTELEQIAKVLEITTSQLVGFNEKLIFNHCKAESQSTFYNCGNFTIHSAEKLYEKLVLEKDKRIESLEKQVENLFKLLEKMQA
jgi:transcriptional regulator with XRE-family HTH domain